MTKRGPGCPQKYHFYLHLNLWDCQLVSKLKWTKVELVPSGAFEKQTGSCLNDLTSSTISISALLQLSNRVLQVFDSYLDSVKWKIFVTGETKHFHGDKKRAKWGQNANYRQFHYGNAIYSLQVEQNRYISSLQIYLDSVKWKIFVTWVTKHFHGVLKRRRNRAKMLIIDNFTTVMSYIRCKLNKIVTYRHYRYTWTVWNKKYSLLG